MRKKNAYIFCTLLAILLVSGCGNSKNAVEQQPDITTVDPEKIAYVSYGMSEYTTGYSDLASMAEASDLIIYGEIENIDYVMEENGYCVSNLDVNVIQTIKGDVQQEHGYSSKPVEQRRFLDRGFCDPMYRCAAARAQAWLRGISVLLRMLFLSFPQDISHDLILDLIFFMIPHPVVRIPRAHIQVIRQAVYILHGFGVRPVVLFYLAEAAFCPSCDSSCHVQSCGQLTSSVQHEFLRTRERMLDPVDLPFQCLRLVRREAIVHIPGICHTCHDLHQVPLNMGELIFQCAVSQHFRKPDMAVQFIDGAEQLDPVIGFGDAQSVCEGGCASVACFCINAHAPYSSLNGSFLIARALLAPIFLHCVRFGFR